MAKLDHDVIVHALRLPLERKLAPREIAIATMALIVVGGLYCQIYCLLALQAEGRMLMPPVDSIIRSSSDLLPAFLVFESGKHILERLSGRAWQSTLAIAALVFLAVALALSIRIQSPMMLMGSLRQIAVDRLPSILLGLLVLGWYHRRLADPGGVGSRASAEPLGMPPSTQIEWVRAAGNYVEIRVPGKTILRRMTLAQAASLLPGDQFVRIHRSVLINRRQVLRLRGRGRIELCDGTEFQVGDSYRWIVEEFGLREAVRG